MLYPSPMPSERVGNEAASGEAVKVPHPPFAAGGTLSVKEQVDAHMAFLNGDDFEDATEVYGDGAGK